MIGKVRFYSVQSLQSKLRRGAIPGTDRSALAHDEKEAVGGVGDHKEGRKRKFNKYKTGRKKRETKGEKNNERVTYTVQLFSNH